MGRGEHLCSEQRASAGKGGTKNLWVRLRPRRASRSLLGHSQEVDKPQVPASAGSGRARARSPGLTVVLALDKGLPLSEPLHADAVDDAGRLLRLECLVQLGRTGPRGGSARTSNPPWALPRTLTKHRTPRESFKPPEEFKEKNPLRHAPSMPMTAANTWMSLVSDFVKTQLRSHGRRCSPPCTEQNLVPCSLLN